MRFQKIREKEKFEDGKHDEKLDQDDDPKPFTNRAEVPETIIVEIKNLCKDVFLQDSVFTQLILRLIFPF